MTDRINGKESKINASRRFVAHDRCVYLHILMSRRCIRGNECGEHAHTTRLHSCETNSGLSAGAGMVARQRSAVLGTLRLINDNGRSPI